MLVLWTVAPTREEGALAAFLSCMEIEPVLHQLFPTHPTPEKLGVCFLVYWVIWGFCFVLSIVNVLEGKLHFN